jgi:hypothetical protein
MNIEIHFTNDGGARSRPAGPLHRANAKSVLKSTELSALKRRSLTLPTPSPRPSGERVGVRGFEFKRTTSPRPSPPTSLAERVENGGSVLNLRPTQKRRSE